MISKKNLTFIIGGDAVLIPPVLHFAFALDKHKKSDIS